MDDKEYKKVQKKLDEIEKMTLDLQKSVRKMIEEAKEEIPYMSEWTKQERIEMMDEMLKEIDDILKIDKKDKEKK